jgi:pimeloyl-ACP methyl ester carboxylesterase
MYTKKILFIVTFSGIGVMLTIGSFAQFQDKLVTLKAAYGDVAPICQCEALMKASIPNTTITLAAADSKDGSCRVTAIVSHPPANDSVKVWIALPVKNWNGRFEGIGGGGFLGGHIFFLTLPLSQGFAVGATNTGHDGGSGSFALDTNSHRLNWQLIRDNAYLGIHDMTVVGKALVKSFYGKPARYAYFVGGSMGGRQGFSEAQRYPDDYDGILSLCPAVNFTRFLVADLWPQVVMNEEKNYISAEKLAAANKAIVQAFDDKDGAIDSVLDDPLHYFFDPQILVDKKTGDSYFTQSDVNVIRKIWEGPRTRDGKFLWYGLLPGTDMKALAGTQGNPLSGVPMGVAFDWVCYFLYMDPKWSGSFLTRDEFDLLWNQSVEQYGEVFATDNADLTRFKAHGGKVIILHGLSDQLIPTQNSIYYYQRLQDRMGGAKGVSEFARLFLLPGLDHGFQGAGPKPVNQFESLIRWVEEKKAPDHLIAELRDKAGNLIRSRSYAPYSDISKMTTK